MGSASEGTSSGGPSSSDNGGGARETAESKSSGTTSQNGMTGSERTAASEAKSEKSFGESLAEAKAENERSKSPNDDDRSSTTPSPTTTPEAPKPDDTAPAPDDGGMLSSAGGFFGGLAETLSAPPADASGNPRSTSPVSDRIDNTVNYDVSDIVGIPAKSPHDAAIEMANAEFGVGMQVMRQDMNRAIDKSVADYDQKIADVDQRLAAIDEQLSPASKTGVGGFGTIGFAPLEDARALLAEGRTLTDQKAELEAKRSGLENARNLPDTLDMAHIARDVYEVDTKLANSHISRLSDQELKDLGFKTGLLDNKETGFHAEVYRNSITGEAILAFQGTDFDSRVDWENNLKQGLGLESPQYKQANRVAREFADAFADEKRSLTGHSLGGGMAAYSALATGIDATTFNAAGLNARTLDRIGVTREEALDLVTAHHVNGEAVNWAQDSTTADLVAAGLLGAGYVGNSNFDPVPEAVGTRHGYEPLNTEGLPADFRGGLRSDLEERVDLHLMESVLNTLRHERQRIEDETRPQ